MTKHPGLPVTERDPHDTGLLGLKPNPGPTGMSWSHYSGDQAKWLFQRLGNGRSQGEENSESQKKN